MKGIILALSHKKHCSWQTFWELHLCIILNLQSCTEFNFSYKHCWKHCSWQYENENNKSFLHKWHSIILNIYFLMSNPSEVVLLLFMWEIRKFLYSLDFHLRAPSNKREKALPWRMVREMQSILVLPLGNLKHVYPKLENASLKMSKQLNLCQLF